MKLGGLFGKQPLAKAPRTPAPKNEDNSIPLPPEPPARTSSLAASLKPRTGGPIPVTWPKVHPQQVKDYRAILTAADLEAYCKRCQETGLASFDWETAASKEARARWAVYKAEYQDWMDQCLGNAAACQEMGDTDEQKLVEASIKAKEAEYQARYKAFLETPLDPHQGDICTASIAAAVHESRVVPISNQVGDVFEPDLPRDEARQLALRIIGRQLFQREDVIKIAVNLAFETKFAARYRKYILGRVADPLTMWVRCYQVTQPEMITNKKYPFAGHGLKPMTKRIYGVEMGDFKKLLEKHGVEFFDEIDASRGDGLQYSAEDADYGLQLYLYWCEVAKQIPRYYEWLHRIEMPFARVLGLMEYHGMAWNTDLADVKRQEAQIQQEQYHAELRQIARDTCGIDLDTGGKAGRNGAVKDFVFNHLKLPVAKLTDAKSPSLDEEAIIDMTFMLQQGLQDLGREEKLLQFEKELPEGWETLTEEQLLQLPTMVEALARLKKRDPHPYRDVGLRVLEILKKIQKYSTLLSAHIEGREKFLHPVTKRIHANYLPWTDTARAKSEHPNGQNVPRLENDELGVRNFYVASPGKILFFIDFNGFELRILTWKSGDPVLTELFNTGGDLHRKTAAIIAGISEDQVTKKQRTDAKPANFQMPYGGTEVALQKTIKVDYGERKTRAECAEMVEAREKAYPGVPVYIQDITLEARDKGYVDTAYGYIRLLPTINSTNNYERRSASNQAANTPIQGTAADFMKRSQNDVYDEIGRGTYAVDVHLEGVTRFEDGDLDPYEIMKLVGATLCHGVTDMIAQIHDEIIFELDDEPGVIERTYAWVKACMEQEPLEGFPVPIMADGSVGYAWGSKMSIEKRLGAGA